MRCSERLFEVVGFVLCGAGAIAQELAEVPSGRLDVDGGVELRARYEWIKDMPGAYGQMRANDADRLRLRAKVWGSATVGDYGIYARIYDEVREFHRPSNRNQHFPSWLIMDNLYLDMNNLLYDRVDLRVGRQDLLYGAGRVIANGTPGETDRFAFNAVKASVRVTDKTTADVFGTYMPSRDDYLAVGNRNRGYYSTSYGGAYGGPENNDGLTEWGMGTYWTVNEIEDFPMEYYLLYKDESRWYRDGTDRSTRVPGRQYGTIGLRLMPQFTGKLAGEFEAAYQFGRTDSDPGRGIDDQLISASMLYAGLTYTETDCPWNPYFKAATLFLSGDGKNGTHDRAGGSASTATGWNPVYSRYVYLGEIPASMYSGCRWTNLIWPYGEIGFSPFSDRHAFRVQTGPMFAHRDDRAGAPAGDDNRYRGWYTQLSYDYLIIKEVVNQRGSLKGRILIEDMAYGDYYYGDHPSNGYFLRVQLVATF
ncbi:MAG: alginate export family protein [Kiritimatiellaeota bacterium]|nr:alginate export family protein [Kiritimatiellota bacterium]